MSNKYGIKRYKFATDFIGLLRHSSRQSIAGVDDINAPLYFAQDQFTIEPFQERFDNLLMWMDIHNGH
jgi:hypothetical protein